MEAIAPNLLFAAPPNAPRPDAYSDLGTQDFLKLLITQLTNQDPLEPTGNQELMQQISSIRNIELSTTLTDSLRTLTGHQQFGSAASLIGQYVVGMPEANGSVAEGLVTGIRFEDGGRPVLQLSNGGAVSMDKVAEIRPPQGAVERLKGKQVAGVDRRQAVASPVEGIVSGATTDANGEWVLELDGGQTIRLRDVVSVAEAD